MESIYRPNLNFTPANNWLNDPNGLVYNSYTGEYHMFFQYCDSLKEDQSLKYWGHAVSKDLIDWKELPPAIPPAEGGIWSGSAIIDADNTSGFFDDTVPPQSRMVAFYTHAFGDMTYGAQRQCVAYSKDNGLTWVKYEGNPIIKGRDGDTILYDGRDPKVFWIKDENEPAGGLWLMIFAGMWARMFTSHDLKKWEFQGDLFYRDGNHIESECPDLFPMMVEGEPSTVKWVYTGSGRFYIYGTLVRNSSGLFEFKEESGKIEPMVGSVAMYAAQTFYNEPLGRRIGIYWLIDKNAEKLEGWNKTWDGYESIPLEFKMVRRPEGLRLNVYPAKEVLEYMQAKGELYKAENIELGDSELTGIFDGGEIKTLDIEAELDLTDCKGFSFTFRPNGGGVTEVSYSCEDCHLTLSYPSCETGYSSFGDRGNLRMPLAFSPKMKIRIIIDAGIVYAIANDGEALVNSCIYPVKLTSDIKAKAKEGSGKIERLRVLYIKGSK